MQKNAVANPLSGKFKFIDLFAGIGGFRIAGEACGGECVFSSEIDPSARDVYFRNFYEMPSGDITKIPEVAIPDHDILCAGFPCQPFSISGKHLGLSDSRGTLFFEIARIAKRKRPTVIFLENVRGLIGHDGGRTFSLIKNILSEIGYSVYNTMLLSSDFGVPQARERVYIVCIRSDVDDGGFSWPLPTDNISVVNDIIDDIATDDLIVMGGDKIQLRSDDIIENKRKPFRIGTIGRGRQGERIYSPKAAGVTLSAYGGGICGKTGGYLIDGVIRKLSPAECSRMQGFPSWFKFSENKTVAYRQFGNSVSVPVVEAVFQNVVDYLSRISLL